MTPNPENAALEADAHQALVSRQQRIRLLVGRVFAGLLVGLLCRR